MAHEVTAAQDAAMVQEKLASITVDDLLDELMDAQDALSVAIKKGDAALIGRIVLDVRQGYAERLACRALYEKVVDLPTTEQVAAMAVYNAALASRVGSAA